MDEGIEITVSKDEAAMVTKVLVAHREKLGDAKGKPRGYTYGQVLDELRMSDRLIRELGA